MRQLDVGRQRPLRALDLELDRQPRAREPADEPRQVGALLPRAQHAEQLAHLLERLAAGLGDLLQRARGGIRGRGVAAAVGLGDHHRQRVRHHVVQLARDPRALLRRPELRLLVALDLERGQALAAADAPVGEQRRHQHLGADDDRPDQGPSSTPGIDARDATTAPPTSATPSPTGFSRPGPCAIR